MSGWGGFWIMVGIIEVAHAWHSIERKKLQLKYKIKFRWWE